MSSGTPFYNPTAEETAFGWIYGRETPSAAAGRTVRGHFSARRALESLLREALSSGPCIVAFSGGRDSSLVLAVAVHVARVEGLPQPMAWTDRHPGVQEADEADFQQLVIDHLGVRDWHVETQAPDDASALGATAVGMRARYGPLWPPTPWSHGRVIAAARGATVITGHGGDDVLELKRISLLHNVIRARGRVSPGIWRATARALAPRVVAETRVRVRRSLPPWLTDAAAERVTTLALADRRAIPLRWSAATAHLPSTRAWTLGMRNLDIIAGDAGARLLHPLASVKFCAAYGREGGPLGVPSRSAGMRLLSSDLLPDAVVTRQTKARFNSAVFDERTREFARSWTGEGVDPELVDAERLRADWLSDHPSPQGVGLLLQAHAATTEKAVP